MTTEAVTLTETGSYLVCHLPRHFSVPEMTWNVFAWIEAAIFCQQYQAQKK